MMEYLMLGFIILLICWIVILLFRKRFTRERYIFVSTSLMFTMGIFIIAHIFYDLSFKIICISLLNKYFDLNIDIPTTDSDGIILSIIIFGVFSWFILKIFKNWNGVYSQKDYERKQKYFNDEIFFLLLENFKHLKINQYVDEETSKLVQTSFKYKDKKKDWTNEVIEILKLISRQYKFSENDYHKEEALYVSKYLKNEKNIAVFHTLTEPTKSQIKEKIQFLKNNYKELIFTKLIVAVKNCEKQMRDKEIDGITVEYRYRSEMIDNMVDFSDYFDYIEHQFSIDEITEGDNLTLKDMYVKSEGLIKDDVEEKGERILDVENYILEWTKDSTKKQIALLGEYGQGKSTLSLKVAYEMIKNKYTRIPIIIELRGKSPRNNQLVEIISHWALNFHIDSKAIMKLLQEGKLLLILEGFDEIDLVGDENIRGEHFNSLWEFAKYSKSKVMITGRPNLFLDNKERKERLNISKDNYKLVYSEAIRLEPFSSLKIEQALRNINTNIKDEILELVRNNNQSFIDLISRPSTLYQVSIIWDSLKNLKNINSAFVISEFIKHSYKRQEEKLLTIGDEEIKPILDVYEREYFMLGIAYVMDSHKNEIHLSELENAIIKLYQNVPDIVSKKSSKPLKERLKTNSNEIQTLFNDIRTFGILVTNFSSDASFKFAHKSFLEYLLSFFFVNRILKNNDYYTTLTNAIRKSFRYDPLYRGQTSEVLSFISQQLIEQKKLSSVTSISEKHTTVKLLFELIYPVKILNKCPRFTSNAVLQLGIIFAILFFGAILTRLTSNDVFFVYSSLIILLLYIILVISISHNRRYLSIWIYLCRSIKIEDNIIKKYTSGIMFKIYSDSFDSKTLTFKELLLRVFK